MLQSQWIGKKYFLYLRMARIEFLINNPTEVEGNDLDLLNKEIEKYPYFYSLRALKLLALKKANNPEYKQYLPITSLFSSNRKGLFQLVNQPEKPTIEVQQETEVLNEVETSQEEYSTDEIVSELEPTAIVETISDTKVVEENLIEEAPINDEIIEEDQSLVAIPTDEIISEELNIETITEETEADLEDKNAFQLYEEIVETLPLPETPSTELVDFAIPNVEEQKNIQQSVEKSLEVANEILDHTEKVEDAIQETLSITTPKIEQVGLVNRALEQNIIQLNPTSENKVLNFTPFFVLDTKDKIKRNSPFVSTENQTEEVVTKKNEQNIENSVQEIEEIAVLHEVNTVEKIEEVTIEKEIKSISEEKEVIEPIVEKPIEIDGSFSFNEWLKLPSSEVKDSSIELEQKYQIIDDFLEKNPKIKPIKKFEPQETYIPKQTDFSDLMTETLAQIYIEQKQYEKAIKAYKILSLKYPEKNSLFAKQIKEIENLKNSK